MYCEKDGIVLPDHLLFKCEGHCQTVLCLHHLTEHAREVTFTHKTVPELVKKPEVVTQ